jgi:hypothetical protein
MCVRSWAAGGSLPCPGCLPRARGVRCPAGRVDPAPTAWRDPAVGTGAIITAIHRWHADPEEVAGRTPPGGRVTGVESCDGPHKSLAIYVPTRGHTSTPRYPVTGPVMEQDRRAPLRGLCPSGPKARATGPPSPSTGASSLLDRPHLAVLFVGIAVYGRGRDLPTFSAHIATPCCGWHAICAW